MDRKIQSALISVFYKDGLEPVVKKLHEQGVTIYSTGGTQTFIEGLGIPCTAVESVTGYPSILGGRVKTLHPKVFGGILARRELAEDLAQTARASRAPLRRCVRRRSVRHRGFRRSPRAHPPLPDRQGA